MPDLSLLTFLAIALATLGACAAAVTRRNIIHSALLLVAGWAGIAACYLWAGAEFVAFAQILVYVGAVSMVVLFAVLLTRLGPGDTAPAPGAFRRAAAALLAGGACLGALAGAILTSPLGLPAAAARAPAATGAAAAADAAAAAAGAPAAVAAAAEPAIRVREIGLALMEPAGAAALLVTGVLLTVALIGAIVIASNDRRGADNSGEEAAS
ncbi:MAG: NADH-quinone oxidoreductase subunit J [Opitutaceae bacterium]|jgi:NADH:ubiquinone oxidoreductase subunit 6 (subunit J)|nr:NADH-quinone oxidoreductase subunit J [Opitutaceae bacterium]